MHLNNKRNHPQNNLPSLHKPAPSCLPLPHSKLNLVNNLVVSFPNHPHQNPRLTKISSLSSSKLGHIGPCNSRLS